MHPCGPSFYLRLLPAFAQEEVLKFVGDLMRHMCRCEVLALDHPDPSLARVDDQHIDVPRRPFALAQLADGFHPPLDDYPSPRVLGKEIGHLVVELLSPLVEELAHQSLHLRCASLRRQPPTET